MTRTEGPIRAVAHIDLSDERGAFQRATGCTAVFALWGEHLYRLFLAIRAADPSIPQAPTMLIALFWHLHMRDTGKYGADCEALFGPVALEEAEAPRVADDSAAFDKLCEDFENAFGVDPCAVPFLPSDADDEEGEATLSVTGLSADALAALNSVVLAADAERLA